MISRPHGRGRGLGRPRPRLRGRDAAKLNLVLTAGLMICVASFTIEWLRALRGNQLSWVYVIEWPILAAFAIYLWWHLLHDVEDDDKEVSGRAAPEAFDDTDSNEVDEDLAAWQEYLRALRQKDASDEADDTTR